MGQPLLDDHHVTKYRSAVARANFLSIDRLDILVAVEEAARRMAKPRRRDFDRVTRIARYHNVVPRLPWWYRFQTDPCQLTVITHSDCAGCQRTRRSTTGGTAMYGSHVLKSWCRTQAVIALPSAEAELYGAVRASAEAIGLTSMLKDMDVVIKGRVMGDANATLGLIQRTGLRKLRHVHTEFFWCHEKNTSNDLFYAKVTGKDTCLDLMAMALSSEQILHHIGLLGGEFIYASDKTSLPIHYLACTSWNRREAIDTECQHLGLSGTMGAWTRFDLRRRTFWTTARGGPNWAKVLARIPMDAGSGEVITSEPSADICRSRDHALVDGGPRDSETVLFYDDVDDMTSPP